MRAEIIPVKPGEVETYEKSCRREAFLQINTFRRTNYCTKEMKVFSEQSFL